MAIFFKNFTASGSCSDFPGVDHEGHQACTALKFYCKNFLPDFVTLIQNTQLHIPAETFLKSIYPSFAALVTICFLFVLPLQLIVHPICSKKLSFKYKPLNTDPLVER